MTLQEALVIFEDGLNVGRTTWPDGFILYSEGTTLLVGPVVGEDEEAFVTPLTQADFFATDWREIP